MPAPNGNEIRAKAAAVSLDKARAFSGKIPGGAVSFTPARLDNIKSPDEFEQGFVIGLMESTAVGDETKLPPGKYNIYVSKEGGTWKAYAENNGKVVAEAIRVTVEEHSLWDRASPEGRVNPDGWCIYVCWASLFGWCVLATWICF